MVLSLAGSAANLVFMIGLALTFLINYFLLAKVRGKLPTDVGRAFAVGAEAAKGKPRGAGLMFILVFFVMSLLLCDFSVELLIYLCMIVVAMITGFLDDESRKPWSGLKKGLCDFAIALACALTFVFSNSTEVSFLICDCSFTIPAWLYVILAIILIWASINVTNCTDGVDGLSSSLATVVLLTFFAVYNFTGADSSFAKAILVMVVCVLPYLWFNCSPSILLMGDAGSRSLGLFFALIAMKSGRPFVFIPLMLVFIVDGGIGLIKVSLLKFLKIRILKNTRTPLHDHARKNKGWSDTQTVIRFAILQAVISTLYLYTAFIRPF